MTCRTDALTPWPGHVLGSSQGAWPGHDGRAKCHPPHMTRVRGYSRTPPSPGSHDRAGCPECSGHASSRTGTSPTVPKLMRVPSDSATVLTGGGSMPPPTWSPGRRPLRRSPSGGVAEAARSGQRDRSGEPAPGQPQRSGQFGGNARPRDVGGRCQRPHGTHASVGNAVRWRDWVRTAASAWVTRRNSRIESILLSDQGATAPALGLQLFS